MSNFCQFHKSFNQYGKVSSSFFSALSFMLMEIVCLSDGSLVEKASERKRKKDIGLTSIYFYVKLYTFYYSHPATPPLSLDIRFFSSHTVHIGCDTNMEMVLPANYSIVVSCALNLLDCQLSPQTQVAPHSRRDIKFYYHKGSTYRQHKI